MNSRVGNDPGIHEGEGADGELEDLEPVGGEPGLGVSGLGSVEGQKAVPGSGEGAGFLERDSDEVGLGYLGLEGFEDFGEVGFGHLLYSPFRLRGQPSPLQPHWRRAGVSPLTLVFLLSSLLLHFVSFTRKNAKLNYFNFYFFILYSILNLSSLL